MSLKYLPAECRPREKLLLKGPSSLSNAELLAIFLRTGVSGMNAIELAGFLLEDFGSLRALMEADLAQFSQRKGLGSAKYAQLQATLELSRRHLNEMREFEDVMQDSQYTKRYLKAMLRDKKRESFVVLYLDNQHRPLRDEILFEGTINAAGVYPREVVRRSLELGANAVILAHNHPSGVAEPSRADRQITHRIVDALALVDIRVLDHMIIGDGEVMSFAERGWI